MRAFSKILAALVMGVLAAIIASPLAALFVSGGGSNVVFLVVLALTALVAIFAPTGRRAWGRGSLIVGALFIAMPLFVTGLSAQVGSSMVTDAAASGDEAATAIGATLGGGLMVGASMFIGFIAGTVFLILGLVLVLGGRREVVVVSSNPDNS